MLVEVLKFVSSDGIGVSQGNSLKKKKKIAFLLCTSAYVATLLLKENSKKAGEARRGVLHPAFPYSWSVTPH